MNGDGLMIVWFWLMKCLFLIVWGFGLLSCIRWDGIFFYMISSLFVIILIWFFGISWVFFLFCYCWLLKVFVRNICVFISNWWVNGLFGVDFDDILRIVLIVKNCINCLCLLLCIILCCWLVFLFCIFIDVLVRSVCYDVLLEVVISRFLMSFVFSIFLCCWGEVDLW